MKITTLSALIESSIEADIREKSAFGWIYNFLVFAEESLELNDRLRTLLEMNEALRDIEIRLHDRALSGETTTIEKVYILEKLQYINLVIETLSKQIDFLTFDE